ncbi:HNH endonuclease [Salinibacterium sp. SWN167]|uniref:HNH endonuclease n=1 Tax=Salinibacterium sp. SWN167 TaxID=2792054 RepID=UPI0018CE0C31|nr:HNH endonuclease signature motif containing protein [Salinibacterium sp. SWN167]MBH0084338.1 HNH endonuclease [Salinibacterium sp. SWN167]
MPLLTKIHKVAFKTFEDQVVTYQTIDPSWRRGPLKLLTNTRGGDTDKNLTLEFKVKGYATRKAYTARRTRDGKGTWLLSDASVESQKLAPLELRRNVDTSDLKAWRAPKRIDGQLWLFQGWAYFADDPNGLVAEDVRALINVEANKRRLLLEKAHALQAVSDNYDRPKRRESISQVVRVEVWQRDGGHCVECNSQAKLEFDHIIPVAMGGGNTSRNLQLLCETCNRRKGASLG